jgi:hypothetical protein
MYCEGYLRTFPLVSLLLMLQVRVFPQVLEISTFFSDIQSCRVCFFVCLRFEVFRVVKLHVLTICSVVDWYHYFLSHLENGSIEFPRSPNGGADVLEYTKS